MICGLVSTYREGELAVAAVRSLLPCCDVVHVFEGPIGDNPAEGVESDWSSFRKNPRVNLHTGAWETDAAKRTAMLAPTRRHPDPWGVILDGDEVLLWAEYLPDQLAYMRQKEEHDGEVVMGTSLRLVEIDGSVAQITARVLRLKFIERVLVSSSLLQLTNGVSWSRPNFPLLGIGEPDQPPRTEEMERGLIQRRRPLHGEPHILHRSAMRAPQRQVVQRQHVAEAEEWAKLAAAQGLTGNEPDAQPSNIGIWVPDGSV